MPRLTLTYGEFIEIISRHGFQLHRHDGGSHQRWRAEKDGRPVFVTVAAHSMRDEISPGTLASMIRQSELGSVVFGNLNPMSPIIVWTAGPKILSPSGEAQ